MSVITLFVALALACADGGAPLPVDAGSPVHDAGAAAHDAGVHDAGAAAHDAGAAVHDAGAAVHDAGPAEEAIPATVHERPSPLTFRVAANGRTARMRANDAGTAFTAALEADAVENAPYAAVHVKDGVASVEVRGRSVATLVEADAAAEGSSLDQYAAELETRLISFVRDEERRSSLQALALRVFFSVLLGVLGVLTLRAVRRLFTRWETQLDERGPRQPLRVLGQPVLSTDALRGALSVTLIGGRLLASIGIVVVVLVAVLGQFEATRPFLARLGGWASAPVVRGVDALVSAVPGLVLAAILIVAVRAALRFLRVLLDGVAEGRISSNIVAPARVFPVRVVVSAGLALITAPLIVAAAFGRFGTPLESVVLAAAGVSFLAAVPMLASVVAGVVLLWRGAVRPGDWIEVGAARGEIVSVHLVDLVIVPEAGGTIRIPHIALALSPLRVGKPPRAELDVVVARDRPLAKIEEALHQAASAAGDEGGVDLLSVNATTITCRLFLPLGKPHAKDALVRAVVDAAERGDIVLHDARA